MPRLQVNSITVETEEYGTLYLRSSFIIKDSRYLSELQESDIDAREFTAQAISRLIYSPKIEIEEIRSWSNELLITVAKTWTEEIGEVKWPLREDLPFFEAFKQGHLVYVANMFRYLAKGFAEIYAPSFTQMIEASKLLTSRFDQQVTEFKQLIVDSVQSSINHLITSTLGSLQQNLNNMFQSITLDIDVGRLFTDLPDLSELIRRYEEIERTADVLDRSGFAFMRYQWGLNEVSQFIGVEQIDPRVRDAVVINRLLGLSRSPEFLTRLENYFHSSSVLRRRWPIVSQALSAHRHRQYILSIPVLLAQVEGIFTDALIFKNMAIRQNGRLYAKDQNGNIKLGRDGRPVQLSGLGQKVQNSSFRNNDVLVDLVEFFTNTLVAERNDILHGNNFDYARAKLSVQLVFNTYILAAEFAEFEREN